ncbi:uncharacterized protein C16orf96 homolog isoform X1 [Anas platyrhynchos]|uniref:uncharacterized protein C16orf96 homolog isoform X1 n=1 Tax=Anas platyrhynchos TaxID=8839 RepID=UPI000F7C1E2A|eukprot:XP_027324871.1 uncharacterized protein C16orf96 homolog isoform X1 [Anas platyrhynchos]
MGPGQNPGVSPGNGAVTSAPGGQPREPQAAMSVSVTLAELADVAFRTPNGGSVNAGALHLLLRGLLEHLRLQDASTQLSEDERGLLEPGAGAGGRPRAVVLQAEGRPGSPRGSPSTTEPPTPRQDTDRTGTDACQTTQLTKRMEAIEEGMTKVTDKLQEMLTTSCSLKTTIEAFQEELQLLKDNFQKAGLEELRERVAQQDKHSNLLQNILDQMAEVRRELGTFPWQASVLCSLCRVSTGELSSREPSPEAPQEPAQEAQCRLSWLPERHVAVETCISCHEKQLQQRADSGTLEDVAIQLERVQGEVKHLQDKGEKGPDFGREVLSQVGQLQEQCMRLQEAAERLWADTEDTQKADEAVLEPKAKQDELQCAMAQLSEMMQDLLQRMSLHGQARRKALDPVSEVDSKVQWEQVWRLSKQCHCQGPCFDTSGPTGLKRHHFHPVKCISCDRPLAMAPRPHLVTVRKASLHLQPRPASAGGTNRGAQQLPGRDSEGSNQASRGPVTPPRPLSASSSLATVCPFGAPADFSCQQGQVDILGIDGVIYKGRLSSQAANGNMAPGRDLPGTKSPQPPAEKTRRTPKYGSHYVSPYSCAAMRTRAVSSGGRWQAAAGGRTAGV